MGSIAGKCKRPVPTVPSKELQEKDTTMVGDNDSTLHCHSTFVGESIWVFADRELLKTTLWKYIGLLSGEVWFSYSVRRCLKVELQGLDTTQPKVCSLIVDEMRMWHKLQYNKQRDAFFIDVNMGSRLQHLVPESDNETLENSIVFSALGPARQVQDNCRVFLHKRGRWRAAHYVSLSFINFFMFH